jgi:hypothetical protein
MEREKPMAKLIQICASQNDLFGLDADGAAYHYNFHTDSWMRLGRGQRDDGGAGRAESRPATAYPEVSDRRTAR